MTRTLQLLFVLSLSLPLDAADSSAPLWIWASSGDSVELHKSFSCEDAPSAARLRFAVDHCDAALILNREIVARARRHDSFIRTVLRDRLRSGTNELVIRATRRSGPAAVALEIPGHVATNDSWKSRAREGDHQVKNYGSAGVESWWHLEKPRIEVFDEYNQWSEARGEKGKSHSAKFQVPEGYTLEKVLESEKDQGSWVCFAFDDRGRLVIGKERRGILRVTLPNSSEGAEDRATVEVLNGSLSAVHGLLFAHGSLYAVANNSKSLTRLRDTTGDGLFDEVTKLHDIPGGGGDHGRHQIVLGPDQKLYQIHGDAVDLPGDFVSRLPVTYEFGKSKRPIDGHVIRTGPDGKRWEVFVAGLRNPYGLAFNTDGELFTYDADAERDTGLPWYRPTRIAHLVDGVDYGWRADERKWPLYHADSLPSVVDIGKGSPTSIEFGTRSKFPEAYRRALYALDWAYGRVLAVHLVSQGASYVAHAEDFLRGRPFNVTDVDFDPSGAMLILTGGRQTQSAIYRLRYTGPPDSSRRGPSAQEVRRLNHTREARELRQSLTTLVESWGHLGNLDPYIRGAARVVLERRPSDEWRERLAKENRSRVLVTALLALARTGPTKDLESVWKHLSRVDLAKLSPDFQLTAARAAEIASRREVAEGVKKPSDRRRNRVAYLAAPRRAVREQFDAIFPSGDSRLDRELARLLAAHEAPSVVDKTLQILATDPPQVAAFWLLHVLATVSNGWTPATRREYFGLLRGARLFLGDEGLPKRVSELAKVALGNVPAQERPALAKLIEDDATDAVARANAEKPERPFVREWTLESVEKALADATPSTDATQRGAKLFREARCSDCHRHGSMGRSIGPDLTGVATRFSEREVLRSLIDPSAVVSSQYRNQVITKKDGSVLTGRVVWNGFRKSRLHVATNPLDPDKVVHVQKKDIASRTESPVSPMPAGLLDTLDAGEIAELLAFLGIR